MKTVGLMFAAALIAASLAAAPAALTRSESTEARSLKSRVYTLEQKTKNLTAQVARANAAARSAGATARAAQAAQAQLDDCIAGVLPQTRYSWQVEYLDVPYSLVALDVTAVGGSVHHWLVTFKPECVTTTQALGLKAASSR